MARPARFRTRRALHQADDEFLVDRARAGDSLACDVLLNRHFDRIRAVCRRTLGHDDGLDDVVQNALLAIARSLPKFEGTSSFTTWIHRIAVNAALDEIRRRQRRPQPTEVDDTAASPTDAITATTDRMAIDQALQRLSPEHRTILMLREVSDLDYAAIGEQLGLAPGTVRSRLSRARNELRAALVDAATDESATSDLRPGTKRPGPTSDSTERAAGGVPTDSHPAPDINS